ncbi:hypothetical protein Scep_025658 [Stephania cephalantha]|uniref:Cyclic nucleotide-binding domain-containing protein n=1 Tax=Stephania cephalantha TaxID=152367 RepID=A0AAP0EJ42_9MAGN
MHLGEPKFVRFQDWSSEKSSTPDRQFSNGRSYLGKVNGTLSSGFQRIQEIFAWGVKRTQKVRRSLNFFSVDEPSVANFSARKKVLDPQGPFLQKWNKIFMLSCVIAVYIDPLFFYTPNVNRDKNCFYLDKDLEIVACVLRSFIDVFYILHIIFKFRTGFIAPPSRVFGRGVLVEDFAAIAKWYLSSSFVIDILAILPLPQVIILIVIPALSGSVTLNTKNILRIIIFLQYFPRIFRVYPLYKEVTGTSGLITETAWAGAAFNLFLYMLASHIFGASWYLFSIERLDTCWRRACKKTKGCNFTSLYCDYGGGNVLVNNSCPLIESSSAPFDFGIYLDALKSDVVESVSFPRKFFYCLWWGLRNLSSLGQNLKTSTYTWEVLFAVSISVFGLILFALLIGNMQTYLQSSVRRLEEMRVRRQDAEQWMSHRLLPEDLRERLRRYEQYKWQETRGVDEENLLCNLPKDLKRDIKRHLCLSLVTRVPIFEKMDERLLDAMCDRLKPVLYTEQSFINREGDPVSEMLFIMRGKLLSDTTNGGRTGFFNSDYLKAGDFCGEELLTWALDPNSSPNLPLSTRTVQTLTEVEAFALMADDLKFVASQFRRLNSKHLRHTFRYYSQQWRTWAACFIQVAWRRHHMKNQEATYEEENRLQDALVDIHANASSLAATVYASRFAAKALHIIRPSGTTKSFRLTEKLPPMLPQKPSEPNFTSEGFESPL